MSWWRKVLRIATVVVPVVTTNKKVTIGTQVVTSALTDKSPEEGAATLIVTAVRRGAKEPKIRRMALKIHRAIKVAYKDDPKFN